jgi:hypothetical protein
MLFIYYQPLPYSQKLFYLKHYSVHRLFFLLYTVCVISFLTPSKLSRYSCCLLLLSSPSLHKNLSYTLWIAITYLSRYLLCLFLNSQLTTIDTTDIGPKIIARYCSSERDCWKLAVKVP